MSTASFKLDQLIADLRDLTNEVVDLETENVTLIAKVENLEDEVDSLAATIEELREARP